MAGLLLLFCEYLVPLPDGLNGADDACVRILMWTFSVVNRKGSVLEGQERFKYTL